MVVACLSDNGVLISSKVSVFFTVQCPGHLVLSPLRGALWSYLRLCHATRSESRLALALMFCALLPCLAESHMSDRWAWCRSTRPRSPPCKRSCQTRRARSRASAMKQHSSRLRSTSSCVSSSCSKKRSASSRLTPKKLPRSDCVETFLPLWTRSLVTGWTRSLVTGC